MQMDLFVTNLQEVSVSAASRMQTEMVLFIINLQEVPVFVAIIHVDGVFSVCGCMLS